MALPRTKEVKKEKSKSFLSHYQFPVGAIYNVQTMGGSEVAGTASVNLLKSADNYWLKQKDKKREQSMIDYANAELERVYGMPMKSPCHDV